MPLNSTAESYKILFSPTEEAAMIVEKSEAVEKSRVELEGVKGVWIRWLIGEDSGAPNFFLRLFEVEPGGHTPFHSHPFEHEVYVLSGEGRIIHWSRYLRLRARRRRAPVREHRRSPTEVSVHHPPGIKMPLIQPME